MASVSLATSTRASLPAARGKSQKARESPNKHLCALSSPTTRPMMLLTANLLLVSAALVGLCRGLPAGPNSVKVGETLSKSSSLLKVLYPQGAGESGMALCERWSVCSRVDTYALPWVERLCTCRNGQQCSTSLHADDGHTIVDRTRQYKVCESADHLPTCRFFKDITWTHITSGGDTKFQQRIHCRCPANSTTYISGHDVRVTADQGPVYYFHFSCSPVISIRCRRKEPCRLFTVRKRFPVEEVTTNNLCTCPEKTSCPQRHTDPFVLSEFDSTSRPKDGTRTYSAFCNEFA